jgi:hypothetical protein
LNRIRFLIGFVLVALLAKAWKPKLKRYVPMDLSYQVDSNYGAIAGERRGLLEAQRRLAR